MTLSTEQKHQMMDALLVYQKEVEFQQMTVDEQQALHKEYNEHKDEFILLFGEFLGEYTLTVYEELESRIDEWASQKEEQNIDLNSEYPYTFDFVDTIFLMGVIPLINRVMTGIPIADIESHTKNAYEESALYFQKHEIDKIENETGTQITPGYTPSYNPNDTKIYNNFKDFTVKSIQSVGDKYAPVLKKIINKGYEAKKPVKHIAENMKKAVNPEDEDNKVDYIINRISATEMAFYFELGKVAGWNSIGIGKKQFISQNDSRTCILCLSYDGTVLDVEDYTIWIPVHPWCRCCWIPVYDAELLVLPFLALPLYDPLNSESQVS